MNNLNSPYCLHVFLEGRVQGVFFRETTLKQARRLSLTGWVKNLANGQVEVLAEGEKEPLLLFLSWLKRGPIAANVERISQRWKKAEPKFLDFQIV